MAAMQLRQDPLEADHYHHALCSRSRYIWSHWEIERWLVSSLPWWDLGMVLRWRWMSSRRLRRRRVAPQTPFRTSPVRIFQVRDQELSDLGNVPAITRLIAEVGSRLIALEAKVVVLEAKAAAAAQPASNAGKQVLCPAGFAELEQAPGSQAAGEPTLLAQALDLALQLARDPKGVLSGEEDFAGYKEWANRTRLAMEAIGLPEKERVQTVAQFLLAERARSYLLAVPRTVRPAAAGSAQLEHTPGWQVAEAGPVVQPGQSGDFPETWQAFTDTLEGVFVEDVLKKDVALDKLEALTLDMCRGPVGQIAALTRRGRTTGRRLPRPVVLPLRVTGSPSPRSARAAGREGTAKQPARVRCSCPSRR